MSSCVFCQSLTQVLKLNVFVCIQLVCWSTFPLQCNSTHSLTTLTARQITLAGCLYEATVLLMLAVCAGGETLNRCQWSARSGHSDHRTHSLCHRWCEDVESRASWMWEEITVIWILSEKNPSWGFKKRGRKNTDQIIYSEDWWLNYLWIRQ